MLRSYLSHISVRIVVHFLRMVKMKTKTTLFTCSLDMDPDLGYGEHISLNVLIDVFEHQRKQNPDTDIRVAISNRNEIELYCIDDE